MVPKVIKDSLVATAVKGATSIVGQGPWAIISLVLLLLILLIVCGLGWAGYYLVHEVGTVTRDYVMQSSRNNELITANVNELADKLAEVTLMTADARKANVDNTKLIQQNATLIQQNSEQNAVLIQKMQSAEDQMFPAISAREEQLKVLRDIKALLEKS